MFLFRSAVLVALTGGLVQCSGWARDWLEFRGPTAQGLVAWPALPLEWSATKNIAWKQAIPGRGWSSPVLKDGRVYLTTAVSTGGAASLRALCLDERTGKVEWNHEVFASSPSKAGRMHNKNSQASATPLISGDRIFVHFGHLGTACLQLDGTILWKNDTIDYPPVHGNGGSPVLVDNALIFSCDGASNPFVIALNAGTGAELWRTARVTTARKTFSFSTPLVLEVKGKPQVISPGSGVVCGLDPVSGREIWRVRYGEGYSVVPRPVYSREQNLLYLSSGFDRPVILAIRPDGSGDVTDTHVAWRLSKGAPTTPSPLLVGNELYLVSDGGIASCVDAKTGKVHWQERVGGNYSASPVAADGRIYLQNEEGVCVVIRAGKTFAKLAENNLGERSLASFGAGPGAFYIRTEENLYKIGQ